MTVLVTGATGVIGSHLVRALKERGEDVVVTIYTEPKGRFLSETLDAVKIVSMDIRDYSHMLEVVSRYGVDEIYHLAALAKVAAAQKDPMNTYRTNVMGTVSVLEAARQCDVKKVLVMLTDKVYGNRREATENSPVNYSEPYSTSKACQRLVTESYMETYGMDIVLPHSCNVFGYDPFSSRIFPNVIKKCLRGKAPAIFTNDKSVREYIYVEDLVVALLKLMGPRKRSSEGYHGVYNISTGWVHTNEQIVLKILDNFPNLPPVYTTKDNLPKQIDVTTMKSIRKEFVWGPTWSMDEAIDSTVAQFIRYKDDWGLKEVK